MAWQRIRGHDAHVQAFDRARRAGRLGHAFLFIGPPGVGKRLFATELAKALLCESAGDRLEACDRCTSCILFDGGTHPDFFAVARPEDKNELPLEVMKELCGNFALKAGRGRGKVAVVDDADDLNEESANCFLKTLEEPPPRSVFILIGTSAERQVPTITSRCQVVRFAPLPETLLREILTANEEIEPALVPRLLLLAHGSPGEALALADPALWEFRTRFLRQFTPAKPDTVTLARDWMRFCEEAGKEAAVQRRRSVLLVKLLIAFLRDALAVKLHGETGPAEPEERRFLEAVASRCSADQLLDLLERCLEADTHLDRYVQVVLAVESLLDGIGQILRRAA